MFIILTKDDNLVMQGNGPMENTLRFVTSNQKFFKIARTNKTKTIKFVAIENSTLETTLGFKMYFLKGSQIIFE